MYAASGGAGHSRPRLRGGLIENHLGKEHLYNVQGQFFPSDAWTFFLGAVGDNQKYDKSVFGLQKDDTNTYNAELSYAPGDSFNVFLFSSRQDRKVKQAARQSGAAPLDQPTSRKRAREIKA